MGERVRDTLSEPQAHECLRLVKEHFRVYLDAEAGYRPILRYVEANGDKPPFWAIVWESGSPHEWAHLATAGGVDEELAGELEAFGGTLAPMEPVPWPDGVHAEVGDYSFIVHLYPDN